jgi:hypothetical protein
MQPMRTLSNLIELCKQKAAIVRTRKEKKRKEKKRKEKKEEASSDR